MTGGTIDAQPYEETPPNVVPRVPSGIPADLADIGYGDVCEYVEICHKDSKDLTTDELSRIVDEIERHPQYNEIRISMGTDHLMQCETAIERLMQERNITGKTVIFVAAMAPLANKETHALENLRQSIAVLGQQPEGFYVIGDRDSTVKPVRSEDHIGVGYLSKDWQDRIFKPSPTPFTRSTP